MNPPKNKRSRNTADRLADLTTALGRLTDARIRIRRSVGDATAALLDPASYAVRNTLKNVKTALREQEAKRLAAAPEVAVLTKEITSAMVRMANLAQKRRRLLAPART